MSKYFLDNLKEPILERRLYALKSRNLVLGVWDPAQNGFIGIRNKFGSRYLDWEGPTIRDAQLTDIVVPQAIQIRTYQPYTTCNSCGIIGLEFDSERKWHHTGSVLCDNPVPRLDGNEDLFNFLDMWEKERLRTGTLYE